MPDQKTMQTRCLGGFSVMWILFGPKLAFFVTLGQALQAHLVTYWWVGWWMWRAGCISQDTFPWQCQVMNGLESNWSLLTHLPATGLPLLIWSFCVCFLFPKIFFFSRTMWLSSILGWSEWNNSKVDGRMHFAFYLPFRNSQIMLTRKQTWKRYDLLLSFRYCNIV